MFSRLVADWLGLETKSACSVFGLVARASFSSLERGLCFCFFARARVPSLERALRPVLRPDGCVSWLERASFARASFLRSSERGVCFRVLRSSELSFARASFWVADLKHRVFGSSEHFFARAMIFCVWSLERPGLRSSEPVRYKYAEAYFKTVFSLFLILKP